MIRKLNYTRHLISYQSTYSKLYALFANDSLQIEVKKEDTIIAIIVIKDIIRDYMRSAIKNAIVTVLIS